ncbi:unnamed protein product, partial [Amoebophrya sp. A25]|eukprot:GSA25T00000127001.1
MQRVVVEIRLPDGAQIRFGRAGELSLELDAQNREGALLYPLSFKQLRPLDLLIAVKRRLHKLRVASRDFTTAPTTGVDGGAVHGRANSKDTRTEVQENAGTLDYTAHRLVLTTPLQCLRLYNNCASSNYYGRVLDNTTYLGHASDYSLLDGLCGSNLQDEAPFSETENQNFQQWCSSKGVQSSGPPLSADYYLPGSSTDAAAAAITTP